MNFLNTFLFVVSIVSGVCILVISPFAIIDYLFGPDDSTKFLKRLKISCSYKKALIVSFTCIGVFLISHFLRKILFQ